MCLSEKTDNVLCCDVMCCNINVLSTAATFQRKEQQTSNPGQSEEEQRQTVTLKPVAYPELFSGGGSTNSVEDRGQRERRSGGGSPLVRGSTQFANE
jgi:hypothetical protein